jgi:hypothetical protein
VENNRYEGTGFSIVGNEDKGYFVALGKYRLTEAKTKIQCKQMIENRDYELILGMIGAAQQINLEEFDKRISDLEQAAR